MRARAFVRACVRKQTNELNMPTLVVSRESGRALVLRRTIHNNGPRHVHKRASEMWPHTARKLSTRRLWSRQVCSLALALPKLKSRTPKQETWPLSIGLDTQAQTANITWGQHYLCSTLLGVNTTRDRHYLKPALLGADTTCGHTTCRPALLGTSTT